jgi:4-hydroxy-2-oxoheptanedioate aldolase
MAYNTRVTENIMTREADMSMRVNKVVEKMKKGEKAYGCNLNFPSTTLVELAGRAGFDFITFDCEHGPFTPQDLDDLCRIADGAGLTPMARVPSIDDSTILRWLDRGIMGITGPHIINKERAQQLADACRYVPRGKRSFGSGRGAYYGDFPSGPEYMEHTNNNILVTAQLEDVDVLNHLDDILSVEGIDLYALGAQDIAQSMGLQGQPNHPKVKEYENTIRNAVHAAGKKMAEEVTSSARAANLFIDGARAFLNSSKG